MSSNVIDGNKMIAEFMGAVLHPKWISSIYYKPRPTWEYKTGRPTPDSSLMWTDEAMQYHTSWDWLMPVVEKIEAMGFCFGIVKNQVTILQETGRGNIRRKAIGINTNEENKKASLYKAVVEFIQWYNQTQTHAEK